MDMAYLALLIKIVTWDINMGKFYPIFFSTFVSRY